MQEVWPRLSVAQRTEEVSMQADRSKQRPARASQTKRFMFPNS